MNGTSLDKLRKICGLLGSEHAGERAAAALKATSMLREAGMTWGNVNLGNGATAQNGDAHLAYIYRVSLDNERKRTTRMAEEITKLKREVDRLKSMWPHGEPPKRRPSKPKGVREAEQDSLLDYDELLRMKIKVVLEEVAAKELLLPTRVQVFFKAMLKTQEWSAVHREAVERSLRWAYAKAGE